MLGNTPPAPFTPEEPRLIELPPKKLVGIHLPMTRTEDRTPELWAAFGPRKQEIEGRIGTDSISMQVYAEHAEQVLDSTEPFEKWAVVEVEENHPIPEGMESYHLHGGLYAVFHHRGLASDPTTFLFAYGDWLPGSNFLLDHREHFEILPEDYSPFDPEAEEEIWIPVRPK